MLSSSLMRVFFLLQLIVISIQGFHHKREISSFEQFVEIFPEYQYCRKSELINVNENLRKSKERECLERQARFNLQLHEIRDHNALNLTWKKEINKFSVMSVYEKMQFLGRTHKGDRIMTTVQSEEVKYTAVNNLPTSIDWRNNNVLTSIKNQGSCGACWAFAAAEAIESFAAIQSGSLYELSTEQITACSPNPRQCGGTGGCGGSTQELAFAYVANTTGLLLRSSYPDTSSAIGRTSACLPQRVAPAVQISGYVTLPINDYSALMNAIANIGPVTVSLDANALFSYSSGILRCTNRWIINHAVQLVGYGVDPTTNTKYWILRNSWGTSFGENGYFRLARSDSDSSNCGTDTAPQDGSACKGDNTPITVCGSCGILSDSSYPLGVSISPTGAPTKRAPTAVPTARSSSSAPTIGSQPSNYPNNVPTAKTTSSPTIIPSSSLPTKTPSSTPNVFPTIGLTSYPSILPTDVPITNPSEAPTVLNTPSLQPTILPTSSTPSLMPSLCPTTVAPSINPSKIAPSVIPSSTPRWGPSAKPIYSPTRSPPTTSPTRVPSSLKPSKNPSPVPRNFPSGNPSFAPTTCPSGYPTGIPTIRPSQSPTTTNPSYAPSAKPSRKPTRRPTKTTVPTTLLPSITPAKVLNSLSSVKPSNCPTLTPIKIPSTGLSGSTIVVASNHATEQHFDHHQSNTNPSIASSVDAPVLTTEVSPHMNSISRT